MSYRLCDGEVYIIESNMKLSRSQMFSFFLNGHMEDHLALYDKNQKYKGIINYNSLLYSTNDQSAIIYDKLKIGDHFWEEVRKVLTGEPDMLIPVFDQDERMICFVKNDRSLDEKWLKLCKVRDRIDDILFRELNPNARLIHIKGINDVLYEMRNWLLSIGIGVSVEGKLWEELFGIKETKYVDDSAIIVDENCYWLNDIFIKYCDWLEKYASKLKEILSTSYSPDKDKKEKIIFYLPASFACIESINSLLLHYLHKGKECICVFISREWIMELGHNNVSNVTEILEKWSNLGVKCCLQSEQELLFYEYEICFCLSEYSNDVPSAIRERSKRVVALQMTAIYTHMYMTGKFDDVFSEKRRKTIDYLVVSDYIADWICEHDEKWKTKILRFGYPKLDTLYFALSERTEIPIYWKKRILNKSVYLFITDNMEQDWLEYFKDNRDNKVAIWRPHPNLLGDASKKKKIEEISKKYNIIGK